MQELESRTDGLWRPSPGAVYPALNQLEDEGLIRATESPDGKKQYELTDTGKAHVEEHREQLGTPWDEVGKDIPDGGMSAIHALRTLSAAVEQVVRTGSEPQIERAKEILSDARKALYKVLSED